MFESSWTSFCITFVTGSPGAGKSYCLVRDLYARMAEHSGPVVTNLPINVPRFAEACAARYGRPSEEIENQLCLVSRELLQRWKSGDSTPGELANTPGLVGLESVRGALFILDECHLFCPASAPLRQRVWESWLGEVRHEGWAGIYFVSQDQSKVGKAIKEHAELQYELTKADKLADPWFGIELGLWWELMASFTGVYAPSIAIAKLRRKSGRLRPDGQSRVPLESQYFDLYQSHQAAGGGTVQEAITVPKLEHEKRPRWRSVVGPDGRKVRPVWLWFLGRTWGRLVPRFVLVLAVCWLCFGGGGTYLLKAYMASAGAVGKANGVVATDAAIDPSIGPDNPEVNPDWTPDMTPEQWAIVEAKFLQADGERQVLSENNARVFASIVQELEPEKAEVVVGQLREIEQRFRDERAKMAEEDRKEEERKEKERKGLRVVAVRGKMAWLSDGSEVIEGEEVLGGKLDGLMCQVVSAPRRRVYFSDGLVLSMGRPNGVRRDDESTDGGDNAESPVGPPGIGATGVPGTIPTGAGGPGSASGAGTAEAGDN